LCFKIAGGAGDVRVLPHQVPHPAGARGVPGQSGPAGGRRDRLQIQGMYVQNWMNGIFDVIFKDLRYLTAESDSLISTFIRSTATHCIQHTIESYYTLYLYFSMRPS
jgi:hypothetical protein